MEVASELVAFRREILDATIRIPHEFAVGDDAVNMCLNQLSFQGRIVDAVTTAPLVPTTHVAKSKLAETLISPRI